MGEVLSEGMPGEFRESLLTETLRLARKRRRVRQVRRFSSAIAALVIIAAVMAGILTSHRGSVQTPRPGYQLILTAPLPESQIVTTRALPNNQIVTSVSTANIVSTTPGNPDVREISDEELLALVPQPAALVRLGPHRMELVIVKADNQTQPPVN